MRHLAKLVPAAVLFAAVTAAHAQAVRSERNLSLDLANQIDQLRDKPLN